MMRSWSNRLLFPAMLLCWLCLTRCAWAFPEFQAYSQQHSGRFVNCGMCHVNPDGPIGNADGQLSRLTPAELAQVNIARNAANPGVEVHNPILNAFGNKIITEVGTRKLVSFRQNPAALAAALDPTSDMDGDGIPDAREFLDGTDPLNPESGDPGLLMTINLQRGWQQALFMIAAIALLVFGLTHVVNGLRMKSPQG